MQLTQLDIKGFKSFGDKITINFNEGVTAIVGPNGCGKSNVVDAIRWVLGEQSTRMLRSEKMENIIFNGSRNRKPSNLAEVSLSFNNTRNILPTEYSTVTITRKLYRSGDSEYRLNDVQCRLKDITDLFLDTGIGSDSYSIIELKMIDEIIANKENSRRALFEEASGISKYKLRKKQTFNKLKDTEADLSRVEDLLFEVDKNLRSLENQAKKAERYYRLRDQYKELSLELASYRIRGFSEALARIEDQEQAHAAQTGELSGSIAKLEAALQQEKLESLKLEKNLSVQQKATNEFVNKIRAYESEKKVKNEQLRFLESQKVRLNEELEKDRNQLNHVIYNQKRLNEELVQETELFTTLSSSVAARQAELEAFRLKQREEKSMLDQLAKANTEIQNQVYTLEKEIAVANIQMEALKQEGNRNVADTASREVELSEFNTVLFELENRLESKTSELELAQRLEDELQLKISSVNEEISSAKEQINQQSRLLDSRQNEYNLTKSMVDNLEGFPDSIRFLRKNSGWARQAPMFSDILFCKEEYRITIENYLEPIMNHYVVEKQVEALAAIRLLSDSARGRANFFVLEAVGQNRSAVNVRELPEHFLPALDVVDTEERYRHLCESLLSNVYIIEDQEEAEFRAALPDENIVLLSKSGRFSKSRTGMSGGSVGLFEGKRIGRAKNLEKLSREISRIGTDLSRLKNKVAEDSLKVTGLKESSERDRIQDLQLELNLLRNELTTVKTKQEQYLAFIENSQNRKQDIELKITSISNELLAMEPQLIQFRSERQLGQEQLMQAQQAYNELSEDISNRSAEYNQENIRFHQQQNKLTTLERDLEYRESQQNSLEGRINKNQTELEDTVSKIKETVLHTEHSDDDLVGMYAQKEEFEKAVTDAEEAYYTSRGKISQLEEEISGFRRKKENADLITAELRDKKTSVKIDLNSLKERLSVEFSVDISDLLDQESEELPEQNEEELKLRTDKLKRQLDEFGAINPMAMEAYNEMDERYRFIQSQKKDLADARSSLMETIREIDDTAKGKFMEAFSLVRDHFIQVFRSLFNEEDSCDLVLLDPANPLESDIEIMARPKGKRPLSINQLSGGEKTLTATALLFSLYLLKPAPFCIFDEVDAPLDDTNIDKFNNIIRKFSGQSQFIIVSHNKRTIASTDIIYGVTMTEPGVSRVVAVDIREVA